MTEETKDRTKRQLLSFDGNIPFTFILGLGLMWATYSWSQMQDLKDRMAKQEAASVEYIKKVDRLEEDQRRSLDLLNGMRSDITLVKELMLRLEKRTEVMATPR
jgi:hypothetical protein